MENICHWKYNKEALIKAVDEFGKKHEMIPLYDSFDTKTRKQLGLVTDIRIDGGDLVWTVTLKNGKCISGRAT